MTAKLIDGRAIAVRIAKENAEAVMKLGFKPSFAALLIGDNAASRTYVSLKERACRDAGLDFRHIEIPSDTNDDEIIKKISALNDDKKIHAILVQLPLPPGHDTTKIISAIAPHKDVDGFTEENAIALFSGKPRIIPPMPAGMLELLKSTGETLNGKNALVVANSKIFFESLKVVLESAGLKPEYSHPDDKDLIDSLKNADIVITAIGRPNFISGEMVKSGAIILDAGAAKDSLGKLCGDVDFASVSEVAGHLTPVPGGVGPMTVAMVVRNAVRLASK